MYSVNTNNNAQSECKKNSAKEETAKKRHK